MSTDIISFVKEQKPLFLESNTTNIAFEKESQFAIQALNSNQILYKTAQNNVASLQSAIINIAAIGISLNPANAYAYLVPRDNKVCLDISYKGLLHIAISTGSIKWGQCKLVNRNDSYKSQGLDKPPFHEYNPFSDRGDVVGGYCTVKTADGDYLTEEMSLEEINKIQSLSKSAGSKFSPWNTHWGEMARKTIVKRASKYWPKVERLNAAINYLNEDAGEGYDFNNRSLNESLISEIEDLESILGVSGSCKTFGKNSNEDLDASEANTLIERMKQTRNLLDQINFIKESIANEDWISAYETLHDFTDEEKRLLWVAPSKGGVFTTEERRIMKEELRTKYNEACEEALDTGIINSEGTKLPRNERCGEE